MSGKPEAEEAPDDSTDSRKRRSPPSPSRARGRSRRRSSSATSPASSAGQKGSESGEEKKKESEKKSSSREPSPEKEEKEETKKRAPSLSNSWERVQGANRRSQARSDVTDEAPRGTLRLKERPQTKVYWGFVTEEELARCREGSGFHCPHWGQDGCRSSKRFGDPNALVQHLQTKHSFAWNDATWTARTTFGLPGQMKDERKPAEPASSGPRRRPG